MFENKYDQSRLNTTAKTCERFKEFSLSFDKFFLKYFCILPPEFVTQHRRPKANYNDMFSNYKDYSPTYVGSILYNGKLVRANANYACFMTMTTTKGINTELPQNLRVSKFNM